MNYMDDIILTVKKEGSWLSFVTYNRKHGRSMRFLTWAEIAMEALDKNKYAQFLDGDCGNFVRLYRVEDKLRIAFTWLSSCNDDDIRGYRQHVEIPYSALAACYVENSTQKFLCHAENSVSAKVDASNACRNIRRAIAEKHSRRAFIRAMRNSFRWKDECVTLYNDGQYDFFFQTDKGLCGGLIRHEYGGKITYSVHT